MGDNNRTPDTWISEYSKKRGLFESFTESLEGLVADILSGEIEPAQISSRTKTLESFAEKIQREGKDYKNPLDEITDLSGVRIITYYLDEVDEVGKIIETEFAIDAENSVNKSQILEADRFGYRSVHYIVSLSAARANLKEWARFAGLKAEIQIRTIGQHAWAQIDHRLRYKSESEIPAPIKRRLYRISALLEEADDAFAQVRDAVAIKRREYAAEVKSGRLDIVIDADSLEVFVAESKLKEFFSKAIGDAGGITDGPNENAARSRLIDFLRKARIERIQDLQNRLDQVKRHASEYIRALLQIYRTEKKTIKGKIRLNPYAAMRYVLYVTLTPELFESLLGEDPAQQETRLAIRKLFENRNSYI